MSTLITMSFDSETSPGLILQRSTAAKRGESDRYGWGFGWYPGDEPTAVALRNPESSESDAVSGVLREWERFRSSTFLCHLRGASKKALQRDTQPFLKSYAGRHWVFAHNGDLRAGFADKLPLGVHPIFEPIGRSDSEHIMCWLLTSLRAEGVRSMSEFGWVNLARMFAQVNELGTANMVLTDGVHTFVHNDQNNFHPLHWIRRVPPHPAHRLTFADLIVDLDGSLNRNRTMVIVASEPSSEEPWVQMQPGETLALRGGGIAWDSAGEDGRPGAVVKEESAARVDSVQSASPTQTDCQQAAVSTGGAQVARATGAAGVSKVKPPVVVERPSERILVVSHETRYDYTNPIEHSVHMLRLRPVEDAFQRVRSVSVTRSVEGPQKEFEDVFGNRCVFLELSAPYRELVIHSEAVVRVIEPPLLESRSIAQRDVLPLMWMPWQRQMMSPYLLPVELPESELQELSQFAMSFVARNDNDLYSTFADINETIYRDFSYVSGSTTLETTPYEVFVNRQGVCQDFANLMICLARLLNVPARYRVGYIFTGGQYENKVQSEASHAWVELYFPWNGWRGFDPTNGCMTGVDHIRVACGRNFRDATPTTGTIYKGNGGEETLTVEVRVEEAAPKTEN